MQEITHDLAQLTEETSKLSDHVGRLTRITERMAEKLGCVASELPQTPMKPIRRRNFKDALEAVLETRERIAHIESVVAAMEEAQKIRELQVSSTQPEVDMDRL